MAKAQRQADAAKASEHETSGERLRVGEILQALEVEATAARGRVLAVGGVDDVDSQFLNNKKITD